MRELLQVQGLTKTFRLSAKQQKLEKTREKVRVAVDDLSFTAYEGEIFGLLGPNGAGKTTTLRMLATLIRPDSGDALLDGASVVREPDKVRGKIGFLTSELKLEEFFTPNYLFDFFSKLHGVPQEVSRQRKEELFARFGIDRFAEVKVADLSTGMKQKVSLVVSIVVTAVVFALQVTFAKVDTSLKQEIAHGGLTVIMGVVILILVFIIGYILVNGLSAIDWEFLTGVPTNGGRDGGIGPAIVGTLELMAGTALIALPLGIFTGVYLAEYAKDTKLTKLIREAIDLLNGTPSIVFGLFGLAFFVRVLDFGVSMVAGWFVLAFMIMPVIIRTTEEALTAVPHDLREASMAMGASKWRTIVRVVLPAAMGGVMTGTILSLGRAAGETAPIMFVAAVSSSTAPYADSIFDSVMALPFHLYYLATHVVGSDAMQYGTATVLLVIVLGMFAIATLIRNHYNKKVKW